MEHERSPIVFDFDGTLADSLAVSLAILYELTHRQPLPKEDMSQLRGMGAIRLLHQLRVPLWRSLFLAARARKQMDTYMKKMELVPGMEKAVHALARQHKLFILTSNNVTNVQAFLEHYGLTEHFADIVGMARPWRKERALQQLAAAHGLHAADVWYVGDRAWDVRAAHRAGMKAAAVTWGFSNVHVLKDSRPDALVFMPDELIELFSKQYDT